MKKFLIFTLAIFPKIALSASGSTHDEGHIPWADIGWQAANLGVLLLVIFFFLKSSIIEAFANRQKDFVDQAEKTKQALKDAELALHDIKTKLKDLDSTESQSIDKAKHESNLLKANIIKDAEAMSVKMQADAQLILNNEIDKAKQEVNDLILKEAVRVTSKKINDNIAQINKTSEQRFLNEISQVKT